MANKVLEICDAIELTREVTMEIVRPLAITIDPDGSSVHVKSIRDLEQIPGTLKFEERDGDVYTHNASKTICGVRFFCLLTRDEYEAVRLQEAS
ncbi:hypothetical protein [Pelotomaculum propionicicum]|nr:hypothetical protein [Pelotomaculum propionicicum]